MKNGVLYIVLFMIGIRMGLPLQAQNNPFKIDDELYSYYMRCQKMLKDKQVLAMADTLFRQARRKGDLKAQCLAWHVKCDHFYSIEDIPSLQKEIRNTRKFVEKTPYTQYIFSTWTRLIVYYGSRKWYGKALKELETFQEEAIRLNSNYGITMSYKQFANIYFLQGNSRKSLELYKRSAEYSISNNGGKDLNGIYRAIGSLYSSLAMPDSAFFYFKIALERTMDPSMKIKDYILLAEQSVRIGQMDTTYYYMQKIENMREKYPLYGATSEQYFTLVVRYYCYKKEYSKAILLCDSIKGLATRFKEKEQIYKSMGDFEQAYGWLQKYIRQEDSTRTTENNKLLADLTSRFDNERLNAEKNRLELRASSLELESEKSKRQLLEVEHERNQLQIRNQNLTLEQQQRELEMSHKEANYQAERLKMLEMRSRQNLLTSVVLGILLATVFILSLFYSLSRRRSIKRLRREKCIAEQARQEAENANRLKSLFLQNMSHEIRTPLNAIVGFTGVLNSDEDMGLDPEERKEMLGLIETNTELLTTLINDILDLSKLESDTYIWNASSVKVSELCHSVLASVAHRVTSGVDLRLKEPDDAQLITLDTDAARLQQVLNNFLTNACKYTEHGSIILAYRLLGKAIEFSVTDTGCGIPPEKVETIFERFEKLDSFKQGTGLGLNICRRIATLVGGQVYVDTAYTGGARFVFVHPLCPVISKKEDENEE